MKRPAPIPWIVVILLFMTSPSLSQDPAAETATAEGEKSTDIEIGFQREHLTNGYAPWRSEYLQLVRRIAARKVVYGRVEHTRRYSQSDAGITAGGYYPLGERWTILAEFNGSPTHNVLASWSGLGQIEHDFGNGWAGHAGLRYRKYNATDVETGNFGVAKTFKSFRVGYTFYASAIAGAGIAATNRVDGTYNYGNSVLNLTFAHGKELENIVPLGVLSTNVRLLNLNGAHWFTGSWGASYSLNWHKQGNIYTRQGLTLGLRYRL
jgi:YaiO family outer membrane protein